ncbi:MAG TPA: L-serine ammonia-lyase, iron-sulfur-dependent, subunit alpha [Catalimonadaceae bacterium]|nr:L-serine ammonia-lyase, iron-sulfur-dependent, subunit alpha [Catalimonadaceae bacterium]
MLFDSFQSWLDEIKESDQLLYAPVLAYEIVQKNKKEEDIWEGVARAYQVMKEAVHTGLTENMQSRSGMVNNSGKKVASNNLHVLSPEFTMLVASALGAKEVNSCMGRVVAAPTAGASGILPGVLTTAQKIHNLSDRTVHEGLLVASGIALIIEHNASLSGAVGGCQAETGSAACMASGALVYMLGGDPQQVFNSVGIVIQCMLGLICDPVAGLVEVPCIVRNASAASIAYAAAQMALSHVDAVIPVDECVKALGEVGQNMETIYKETALGGLAATTTGKAIAKRVLIQDIEMLDS